MTGELQDVDTFAPWSAWSLNLVGVSPEGELVDRRHADLVAVAYLDRGEFSLAYPAVGRLIVNLKVQRSLLEGHRPSLETLHGCRVVNNSYWQDWAERCLDLSTRVLQYLPSPPTSLSWCKQCKFSPFLSRSTLSK